MHHLGHANPMASPKFPDFHLIRLGKITVNFGNLEFIMAILVGTLLRTPDEATTHSVTAGLSFGGRCKLAKSLATKNPSLSEKDRKTIFGLIEKATKAEAARNRYVHSAYVTKEIDGEEVLWRLKSNRQDLEIQDHAISSEELDALNASLADVIAQCSVILQLLKDQYGLYAGYEGRGTVDQ